MKKPQTYSEAVDYIEALPRFTRKHSLEHTRRYLEMLGNPGLNRKLIHVAGTNGKGSVCAYLQAILEAEGKRCGFFTSPHLITINERIQVDRRPVGDGEFLAVFDRAMDAVENMRKEGLEHPSYFEFLFGMGMLAFDRADVEYIILETGLGGRLDATNAPRHPFLTVITSISLDHTDILGSTIEEIAGEKAGIIKPGVPVFFDGGCKEAASVIRKAASQKGAPCREITKNAYEILEVQRNDIAFSRRNAYDRGVIWHVPLCGIYQVMNAELALEAAEYALSAETVHKERWPQAIAHVRWEGRMEEAASHLTVDGAHNPGAIEAFAQSLNGLRKSQEEPLPVLIFSAMTDKNYETMIETLCREVDAAVYIVTEVPDKRKVPAGELARIFQMYTKRPVLAEAEPKDALREAYACRGEGEIYGVGSLYLVGILKKLAAGGEDHA